jgi:hypothetical protein
MKEIIQINNEEMHDEILDLISNCNYCVKISTKTDSRTPIFCTKYSGSSQAIRLNINTCTACGEYRKQNESK